MDYMCIPCFLNFDVLDTKRANDARLFNSVLNLLRLQILALKFLILS